MPTTEQVLSIFLASPSDVSDERERVNEFVNEWNDLWSEHLGICLRLVRWETHSYPAVGDDGQDVINNQIGEKYDVFLGIMWKRLGTPTGRAASGTVEEFERALKRYRASGNPQLMFYFKKADSDGDDDATQLQAVREFRKKLADDGLLYCEFLSSEQFGQLVRVHLTRQLQRWAKHHLRHPETAHATQSELANQFKGYLDNVKELSVILRNIIAQFVQINLSYNATVSQRGAQVRAMSDDEMTEEFMMLSLIRMADEMRRYADAAESFEVSFISAFSTFVENVLGAAAISIALPGAQIKPLNQVLVKLRGRLHPVYVTMGDFIAKLAQSKPQLKGAMVVSNERSISALSKFRERVRFGERMLLESEKLFNSKH